MRILSQALAAQRGLTAVAVLAGGLIAGASAAYVVVRASTPEVTEAEAATPVEQTATLTSAPVRPKSLDIVEQAGPEGTIARMASARARPARDLDCLTQAVYFEARGETRVGQAAVAQVVLNRVRHPAFPTSVCAVVYQGAGRRGCQFSFACAGAPGVGRESAAWRRARQIARDALAGAVVAQVGAATHFHAVGVAPAWGPRLFRVGQIGMHIFYRFGAPKPQITLASQSVESAAVDAVFTGPVAGQIESEGVAGPIPAVIDAKAVLKTEPAPAASVKPVEGASAAVAPKAPVQGAVNAKTALQGEPRPAASNKAVEGLSANAVVATAS